MSNNQFKNCKHEQIDALVADISKTRKYRNISGDLIFRIGCDELTNQVRLRSAIKETKKKLHQVVQAYYIETVKYDFFLSRLETAFISGEIDLVKKICLEILGHHISTAERISILPDFYKEIFSDFQTVNSILDIGCGLNPFTIPWMPVSKGCVYHAWDIFYDLEIFLNETLKFLNVNGQAFTKDFLGSVNTLDFDVALILKSLPCFFQIDRKITMDSIRRIQARYIVISYPTRSIGGKNKGMVSNYEHQFNEMAAGENWSYRRILFPTELVYIIYKNSTRYDGKQSN
jgi:16S rRNA (guanine(1405)-N(7))-methyltransferase